MKSGVKMKENGIWGLFIGKKSVGEQLSVCWSGQNKKKYNAARHISNHLFSF